MSQAHSRGDANEQRTDVTEQFAIRAATQHDAGACRAIYRPFVQHSTVSFETEVPSESTMAGRIQEAQRRHSWLVAESRGSIAGFAAGKPWDPRQAYDWSCETGIYLKPEAQGLGLGRQLYAALLNDLTKRGIAVAIARIAVPNAASEHLHTALGFTKVGVLSQVGWKNNTWLDVLLMQRTLATTDRPPA
jgi:phosphinothricin acetyltransferase